MDSFLDGAGALKYRSPLEASGLRMPADIQWSAVSLESIHWARSAHEHMVAMRHERTAIAAYLMAEARGFEPGHEADDWLLAQSEVDAEDAGSDGL
jgi:hypothetical protein